MSRATKKYQVKRPMRCDATFRGSLDQFGDDLVFVGNPVNEVYMILCLWETL